jgi:predicted phosphodiesterase
MKALPLAIILLLVFSAFSAVSVVAAALPRETFSGIVAPRLGLPTFVQPGGQFNVTVPLDPAVSGLSFSIVPSFPTGSAGSASIALGVVGTTKDSQYVTTTVLVPSSAGYSMCDLFATETGSFGSRTLTEPHSVVVRGSFSEPFRIFWFSDPHMDVLQLQQFTLWTLMWRSNFLRPDLVIITGDVVQSPTDEVFQLARSLLLHMEVPVIMMPGNHDHSSVAPYFSFYLSPFNGAWRYGPLSITYLDTGDGGIAGVLSDSQVAWLDATLKANSDAAVKIVGYHHPMYSIENPSNSTVDRVYNVMKADGVSLVINGHMHEDLVFNGPVMTLTNSNAYPGGRPYSGFRFLTVYSDHVDYLQNGGLQSFNLDDFRVTYSQLNDGSTRGERVLVENNLPIALNGTVVMRLAKGSLSQPNITGATPSKVDDLGSYLVVTLPISLQAHQSRTLSGSTEPSASATPPRIVSVNATKLEGPSAKFVNINISVADDLSGVKAVDVRYSTDNKTWSTLDAGFISATSFLAQVQVGVSAQRVFYYLEASNWDGASTSTSPAEVSFLGGSTTPAGAPFTLDGTLIALMAVVAIGVVVAAVFVMKKRKGKVEVTASATRRLNPY